MSTAAARWWIAAIVAGVVAAHGGLAAAQAGPTISGAAPVLAGTSCSPALNVEDLLMQAANQYSAGFPRPALTLVLKALACKQDMRMYRMAVLYACAANDLATARLYYAKISPQYQGPLVQRCQLQGLPLAVPGGGSPQPPTSITPPPIGLPPATSSAARMPSPAAPRSTKVSAHGPNCDQRLVDDLMYEAADAFIAGNAKTALATVAEALVCKQDVSMLRMAAIYACVAHDDSAQRYYTRLPRPARPAVKQRCRQENIELLEAPPRDATATVQQASGGQASCSVLGVGTLLSQARTQYALGFARSALALTVKALGCVQSDQLYRAAATYACAAHDFAVARLYFPRVPPEFQPLVEQRCQQEGLTLRGSGP
jgi:hypothetical protein